MVITVRNDTHPAVAEICGIAYYIIPYNYVSIIGPERWWRAADLDALFAQIHAHWTLTIWIAIAYSVGIHRLKTYMDKRAAFELRWPLFFWNSALAVFSVLGFVRMSEEFSHVVRNYPLLDSISYPGDPREPAGFWCFAFAISKLLELFDTVFIVLRKKRLIFLHWYHHAIVLVIVWHTLKEAAGSGRWFIFMNYGEHALMYAYYALSAVGLRMPRAVSVVLTALQTAQMFTGVAISFIVLYWKLQGRIMQQSYENLFLCFAVYVSFAVLFCNFFNKSYIEEKGQKTKAL